MCLGDELLRLTDETCYQARKLTNSCTKAEWLSPKDGMKDELYPKSLPP